MIGGSSPTGKKNGGFARSATVSGETPRRRISVTHCSCDIWSHESDWRPTLGVSRLFKQMQQQRQPNLHHTSASVTFDQLSEALSACSADEHGSATVRIEFVIVDLRECLGHYARWRRVSRRLGRGNRGLGRGTFCTITASKRTHRRWRTSGGVRGHARAKRRSVRWHTRQCGRITIRRDRQRCVAAGRTRTQQARRPTPRIRIPIASTWWAPRRRRFGGGRRPCAGR